MNVNQILQRGDGLVRDAVRVPDRVGRWVLGAAVGIVQEARPGQRAPKLEMDDVTLARKVETEIFRGTRSARANVNVNVVDGVVWLRGEVGRPDQIRRLEQKARAVPEVRGVENLLRLPKTPSPTRADTPKRQQRTRSSTRRPTPRRTRGRVSDDRSDELVSQREESPAEHSRRHQGRTPAPLGSTGGASDGEPGPQGSMDGPSMGGPERPVAGRESPVGAPERPELPARAASPVAADSDS